VKDIEIADIRKDDRENAKEALADQRGYYGMIAFSIMAVAISLAYLSLFITFESFSVYLVNPSDQP
jgi:hypothetical protein